MALNLDSVGELGTDWDSRSLGLLLEFSILILLVSGPLLGSSRKWLCLTQAKGDLLEGI